MKIILYGVVMFVVGMDSISSGMALGIHISMYEKGADFETQAIVLLVVTLLIEIIFNVSLLEFIRQITQDVLGEECLDADYGAYIKALATDMRMHFDYEIRSNDESKLTASSVVADLADAATAEQAATTQ